MPSQLTSYKVFIASPGGLNDERRAFYEVINKFNQSAAIHDGIYFQAVGWEDTLGGVGRPQHLINKQLRECDFFILMLCDRWGSAPSDSTSTYTSGTHEEYHVAMECYTAETMKQMVILFKKVDERQLNDPGAQLQQVIDFKKNLEKEKQHLFQNFDSTGHFKEVLNDHLQEWLRWGRNIDNNSGDTPDFPRSPIAPILAPDSSDNISLSESEIHKDSAIIRAWDLANEGKLTEAEIAFSRAVINTQSPESLTEYGRFLTRLGMLDRAQAMFEEAEGIATHQQNDVDLSNAYVAMAVIQKTKGNLSKAEELYNKSLLIEESAGRLEGMASQYGNLGVILRRRGELDEAEKMLRKSLAISESLGQNESIIAQYGNLGNVLQMRGDFDGAEKMYRQSILLNKEVNNLERESILYNNLGNVLHVRGDLEGAEEMYRTGLLINEQIGRIEGMAVQYGNLGIILRKKGDLDGAEEMHHKSLSISEKIGRLEGIASQYGNLGNVSQKRDDLDNAEKMYYKSLELYEQINSMEGIASQYGNLGVILQLRGDLEGAEELYYKSLLSAQKMGSIELIKKAEEALSNVRAEKE